MMNVTVETSGNVVIAYLIGEIDHHTAGEVREEIDNAVMLNKPCHLIIDFRNVTFMDSSGIGLVMGRYRLLQSILPSAGIEIKNVTPQTKKIMELAGLGRISIIKELKNEEVK
ncbi:MAG: anti-sigma factor antagonist [Clostridiales bacterium]|nr:anti-sigma factor antagonist [Clostridiales bacterium]